MSLNSKEWLQLGLSGLLDKPKEKPTQDIVGRVAPGGGYATETTSPVSGVAGQVAPGASSGGFKFSVLHAAMAVSVIVALKLLKVF